MDNVAQLVRVLRNDRQRRGQLTSALLLSGILLASAVRPAGAALHLVQLDAHSTFLEAGGMQAAVRLLTSSIGAAEAAELLWWACRAPDGRDDLAAASADALATAGGVAPLVQLLQDPTAPSSGRGAHTARTSALSALDVAAKSSDAVREAAVAAGCVPALLAILSEVAQQDAFADMDKAAQSDLGPAVGILATLASNHADALLSAGAAEALVQLLRWGNPRVGAISARHTAMQALHQLAHQRGGRQAMAATAIAAAGGVAAAVQCLQAELCGDVRMPQLAASLLGDMVVACPRLAADIRAAGAVPRLEHMLRHSPATKERGSAAVALASLRRAAAAAAAEEIAAAGALPGEPQAASLKPPRMCAAPGCGNTSGLRKCGGCHTVRYCSQECCRAHWPEHRAECRRLQAEAAAEAEEAAAAAGCADVPA